MCYHTSRTRLNLNQQQHRAVPAAQPELPVTKWPRETQQDRTHTIAAREEEAEKKRRRFSRGSGGAGEEERTVGASRGGCERAEAAAGAAGRTPTMQGQSTRVRAESKGQCHA
eukprot:2480183-Rhodomonas_salina.1